MSLQRCFLVALFVGFLPSPAGADLRLQLKRTITQQSPVKSSQTNTMEVSIRGTKRRTELVSIRYGDGPEERVGMFRIDDLAARKSTNVYPFLKGYEETRLEQAVEVLTRLSREKTPEQIDALGAEVLTGRPSPIRLTPMEREKTLPPGSCHEFSLEALLRAENRRLTGTVCISRGAGAVDLFEFAKSAMLFAGSALFDDSLDFLSAVVTSGGMPLEFAYDEVDGTTGNVVSKVEITVVEVSPGPVAESAFEVPRGYRRCAGNACGR